jgi:hypothetical protein
MIETFVKFTVRGKEQSTSSLLEAVSSCDGNKIGWFLKATMTLTKSQTNKLK